MVLCWPTDRVKITLFSKLARSNQNILLNKPILCRFAGYWGKTSRIFVAFGINSVESAQLWKLP